MAALACSMAGDALLMFDGLFLPGLVAFLLAHLAYLALFARGLPWLPSRAATLLVALLGVGMYAFLWQGGLPAGLRLPVALYVLAIGLMVAQRQPAGHKPLRAAAAAGAAVGAGQLLHCSDIDSCLRSARQHQRLIRGSFLNDDDGTRGRASSGRLLETANLRTQRTQRFRRGRGKQEDPSVFLASSANPWRPLRRVVHFSHGACRGAALIECLTRMREKRLI